MEQLELFPNQDYEDALAWLTEGAKGLDYHPSCIVEARKAFELLKYERLSKAEYFMRAITHLWDGTYA